MKTVVEKLEQWAIKKIESEFPDDVCLLLNHKNLKLDKDNKAGKTGFESFVPCTTRANGLARTFIIDGIGYDLFPQTWERFEKMADVDHYNLTCLDDAVVVWARTEADKQRFESLQARLHANLKNPHLMLERAKKWMNTAMELFADTLFEEKVYIVRKNAGYICDLLAIAVAYTNGTFFHHGQTGQVEALRQMSNVPNNFINIYEKIIFEQDPDTQKELCRTLLDLTKVHINSLEMKKQKEKRDPCEIAGWYHELSYTWRKIYHFCETSEVVSAYLWACMLQEELCQLKNEYEVPELDILSTFNADDLKAFAGAARKAELAIINAIEADGGKLDKYESIDEFLEKNA